MPCNFGLLITTRSFRVASNRICRVPTADCILEGRDGDMALWGACGGKAKIRIVFQDWDAWRCLRDEHLEVLSAKYM